jgi:hypothetical protein
MLEGKYESEDGDDMEWEDVRNSDDVTSTPPHCAMPCRVAFSAGISIQVYTHHPVIEMLLWEAQGPAVPVAVMGLLPEVNQ